MNRESKRILYALVVAYKHGIINRSPLNKYIDKERVFKKFIKYMVYLVAFIHVFVLVNEGFLVDLTQMTILGSYQIETYRLYNGFLILPMFICGVKLFNHLDRVIFVNFQMKRYRYKEGDIEVLDRIMFKVK